MSQIALVNHYFGSENCACLHWAQTVTVRSQDLRYKLKVHATTCIGLAIHHTILSYIKRPMSMRPSGDTARGLVFDDFVDKQVVHVSATSFRSGAELVSMEAPWFSYQWPTCCTTPLGGRTPGTVALSGNHSVNCKHCAKYPWLCSVIQQI